MFLDPTSTIEHDKIMTESIHVLGISGSLRAKSTNTGLLRAAAELLPEGMSLEIYDLSAIPMYNQDLYAGGEPAAVQEFKSRIADADALLIATPEYNHSIPGVLKNAIDWASRPYRRSPLNNKPLGIMGAAGRHGAVNALAHLHQIAVGMGMFVMDHPQVAVQRAWEKFDSDGSLTDETTRLLLKELLEALAVWVRYVREGSQI